MATIIKDKNGQMYHVVWAGVPIECKVTWSWFLRVLQDDLEMGNGEGFILITDMQKVSTYTLA